MSQFKVLSFATIAVLCVMATALPHKPVPEMGDICNNYFEDCNPWQNSCCKGLHCVNLRKGWCAGLPFERCVCQSKESFLVDQRAV